jgi:hypothetical protein
MIVSYALQLNQSLLSFTGGVPEETIQFSVYSFLSQSKWLKNSNDSDHSNVFNISHLLSVLGPGAKNLQVPPSVKFYRLIFAWRKTYNSEEKTQMFWMFLGTSDLPKQDGFTLFVLDKKPRKNNETVSSLADSFHYDKNKIYQVFESCPIQQVGKIGANKGENKLADIWDGIMAKYIPSVVVSISEETQEANRVERKKCKIDSKAKTRGSVIAFDDNFIMKMKMNFGEIDKQLMDRYGVTKTAKKAFKAAKGITENVNVDPDDVLDHTGYFQKEITFEALNAAIGAVRSRMKKDVSPEEVFRLEGLLAERFYSNHGFQMKAGTEIDRKKFSIQNATFDMDQIVHEMHNIKLPTVYTNLRNEDFLVTIDAAISSKVAFKISF